MTVALNAFDSFPTYARTWVYQASRPLTPDEAASVRTIARDFTAAWKAHGQPLKATADVLYNRFLIMMVDEDAADASGCSIDSSVAFIRSLENKLNTNFFDRLQLGYLLEDGTVGSVHADRIGKAIELGEITPATTVFDNMVTSCVELRNKWRVPLSESWAASRAGLVGA